MPCIVFVVIAAFGHRPVFTTNSTGRWPSVNTTLLAGCRNITINQLVASTPKESALNSAIFLTGNTIRSCLRNTETSELGDGNFEVLSRANMVSLNAARSLAAHLKDVMSGAVIRAVRDQAPAQPEQLSQALTEAGERIEQRQDQDQASHAPRGATHQLEEPIACFKSQCGGPSWVRV